MKHFRIISVLVVCFLTVIGKAQDSTSHLKFFEDGKSWLWGAYRYTLHGTEKFYWTETVVGDTIVEDRLAKKILADNGERKWYLVYLEEDNVIYRYEYCFWPNINFNLHVGDSIFYKMTYLGEKEDLFLAEVVNEDKINVCGIERRRLSLKTEYDDIGYWVEGIGSNRPDFYITPVLSSSEGYGYHLVKCFNKDGECIFDYDDFFTSTDGIDDVNAGSSDKDRVQDDALYDLSGRRVTGKPRRGIYIKGGQKVLVK